MWSALYGLWLAALPYPLGKTAALRLHLDHVRRLRAFGPFDDLEVDFLSLLQALEAFVLNG